MSSTCARHTNRGSSKKKPELEQVGVDPVEGDGKNMRAGRPADDQPAKDTRESGKGKQYLLERTEAFQPTFDVPVRFIRFLACEFPFEHVLDEFFGRTVTCFRRLFPNARP